MIAVSSAPRHSRALGAMLLKAMAAGALIFSLAGCIPIPVLDITPSAPEAGETVTFDGTGTIVSNIPADTVAVSYRWTFGDGSTGSGASTTHTYDKEGSYDVTLRVIDSAGRVGETKETVTVSKATAVTTATESTTDTTAASSSTGTDSTAAATTTTTSTAADNSTTTTTTK